jgi:uncharacterized protein
MPATTPNVGVRTYLNRADIQPVLIADNSTIGGVFTAPNADNNLFPLDTPVHFTTDDAAMVSAAGDASGTLRQTLDMIAGEGVSASLVVVRVNKTADVATQMAAMVGSASSKTGAYALLSAQAETGATPNLLIGPGMTSQRLGNAANPLATAYDGICEALGTAVAFCSAPSSTKEAAAEWAADFANTLNIITVAQGARVFDSLSSSIITRDVSPALAALQVRTDKERGGPYYNPGNQTLRGILGPSRAVTCNISDPSSEANWLLQRGVNSLVQLERNRTSRSSNAPQGKTFWGFFNTSNDPLWRAINVVRTRKAVREVIPRTLVKYIGQNLGPHLATVLLQSLNDFLRELKQLPEPAILGGEATWERSLNSNGSLRTGGLSISMNFEEAPPLVDVNVYTGRMEAAFNILASDIQSAMNQSRVSGIF